MMIAKQLGMVPSWQFNQGWAQNPNFNNHVSYPPGWNQLTTQPVGANLGCGAGSAPGDKSLGAFSIRRMFSRDCVCDSGREWCCGGYSRGAMSGLGISDAWASRLTIGGALLAVVAGVAGMMYAAKR